jgi:hypothetical protein
MSYGYAFPSGGFLADIRAVLQASANGVEDLDAPVGKDARARAESEPAPPDPFAGQTKWAAWKVTLAVIVFCGAFWTGVAYFVSQLLR